MTIRSLPFSADVVPLCLRQRPQWVCWRYVERDGKPTKCPFNARTSASADSTDAGTWSTFEEAVRAFHADQRYEGIGYVFAADDPYCGVDLDDCIDPTGALKPWGRELVDLLDSYTEISPSGCGVKVFVEARKPGPRCKTAYEDGEVEMYDHDRYFTVTGRHLAGTSVAVHSRQERADQVYRKVFESKQEPPKHAGTGERPGSHSLTDDEIIDKASRSRRSGEKFKALLAGNWNTYFKSQSEADSSLVFTLAFYTKDADQIDRIFRRSGLLRPKWDEQHGEKTYGRLTIDKALATVTAQYRPRRPSQHTTAAADGKSDGNNDDDASHDADGLIALGQREPETGRLVLSPKKTLPTARAYIEEFHPHAEGRTLHSYAGTLLVWRGNRFVEIEEETMRQRIQPWLHDALRYRYNPQTKLLELIDFESNPSTIKSAVESIKDYAHLPATVTPPCWLDSRSDPPDPRFLLPFPSGTLDLATGKVVPATPALFNINAIDFEYNPHADPPERWFNFLDQLWGDDYDSVELLQEWMGYCLVADTSQQKMLLMVGPRRSGKGTIARLLTKLMGAGNVVGPTTSSLGSQFGLQPLIGKSVAIVSDARFTGENIAIVIERLLCISGEDALSVDRKFLPAVTMRLPTRFTFLTNELPRLNDASRALAGRFLMLLLQKSFYGRENITLTQELQVELPGILLWAIEGLRCLRLRGHFHQPPAVSDAVQAIEDLASPVLAFVRDRCETGPGRRESLDVLFDSWRQ